MDKRYRDAGTGEFVSEEYAAANPATTVSEKIDDTQEIEPITDETSP